MNQHIRPPRAHHRLALILALISCLALSLPPVLPMRPAFTSMHLTSKAQANNALHFGGTDSYVTFGPAPALGLPTFTIEAWFKREGAGVSAYTGVGGVDAIPLVTKGRAEQDGSNVDMNYFLGIRASDGVLVADFEENRTGLAGNSPGLNHPVAGVTPILNNTWNHAAATYNGAKWQLFLNGNLEAELTVNQPPRSDSIQHAGLGTAMDSTGAASGFFNGTIDEVRIWNYARTAQQIKDGMGVEIASAPGLVGRWGLNEGNGTSVIDSSGNTVGGVIRGSNWGWVSGTPFAINRPPVILTLNSPADGATNISTSPTLSASVSDPDGDNLTVTFYGKAATSGGPDFTIIALPDTQYYVSSLFGGSPAIFNAQTQWIVDNRAAKNIAYVAQLGDCVENGNNGGDTEEWDYANAAMSLLEDPATTKLAGGIPYGIAVGNHDQSPLGDPTGESTALFNQYFGVGRFFSRNYYGGHYGSNNDNHYELFSAGGLSFIVIHLEYNPSPDTAVLAWADNLLKTYSNRRGIVVSHYIINGGDPGSFGIQGKAIYSALKNNPSLFLMLCGHILAEGKRQDTYNGKTVYTLLSDYQGRANGGNGWLRIMEFSPANNEIRVKTYSPTLKQFETDANSQFTLPYDMQGSSFNIIRRNTSVPSGTVTIAPWSGLSTNTDYEWYVTVSDGFITTTGPHWRFRTGSN